MPQDKTKDQVALDKDQISYLKNVLGLDGVIMPQGTSLRPQPASFRHTAAVQGPPRLLVLAASADTEFPLDGEPGELARKMVQAMKIPLEQIAFAEWTGVNDQECPTSVLALLSRQTPVLVLGLQTLQSLKTQASPTLGEWHSLAGGARVLATYSAQELNHRPELKKPAWAHLQILMKSL